MSLVGPRPIVEAEIAKYGAAYPLYLRSDAGHHRVVADLGA